MKTLTTVLTLLASALVAQIVSAQELPNMPEHSRSLLATMSWRHLWARMTGVARSDRPTDVVSLSPAEAAEIGWSA